VSYKLLALDVDGTLVRRDGSIHPADRQAIGRVRDAGIVVSIVTGRLYSGAQPVAGTLGLSGPVACLDGSHIVDLADDRSLFWSAMRGHAATVVRDVLARKSTASFLFAHDRIVHDLQGAPFTRYVTTWSPNITVVDRVVEHASWDDERGVMAVLAIGSASDVTNAAHELAASLGSQLRVVTFLVPAIGKSAMIVRADGPTKGTAILWLANHHGCLPAEVVAVGDWLNDVPMFEAAGRSFAMGQAPQELKECATDELQADGDVGGGIAEAVRCAWDL
jgi:Cof subfamily protein (haloacid dehalogenase superfamily)